MLLISHTPPFEGWLSLSCLGSKHLFCNPFTFFTLRTFGGSGFRITSSFFTRHYFFPSSLSIMAQPAAAAAAGAARPAGTMVLPTTFSGEATEDVATWLAHFGHCAAYNAWPAPQQRAMLLVRKGFCKVHDERFESGLNCFHAVFSIFQPGLNSQPGLSTLVEIQPGLSCKRAIAFMCVSS